LVNLIYQTHLIGLLIVALVEDWGGLLGAFHLTEIPEILIENQMEHVKFWNDVSLTSTRV
jgi:hypothetical protein